MPSFCQLPLSVPLLSLSLLALASACIRTGSSAPAPQDEQPVPVPLKPHDARRVLSRSGKDVKAVLAPGFNELAVLSWGSWALNGPAPVLLGGTAIALNYRKANWEVDLTPNLFDISLSLTGQLRGDSLVGDWSEYVMGTPARGGRFVMRRTASQ